jgi:gamma-glutamyltranspeptidase/glutathione hydrolase
MILRRLVVLATALLGLAPAAQAAPRTMVAAANPMAVEAGLEVLRRGGTAVDAAIAVQMVLGVVEPQASGLGGGGFLLHYDGATGAITAYDGRETAPAGATPGMFLGGDGKPIGLRDAVRSGLAVGVPGAPAMLELVHKEHGRLAWRELFPAAIALARDGFAAPPRLAAWLERLPSLREEPGIRGVYFNDDGSPRAAGDRVVNRALAETMREIADRGARVLYEGPVAAEIVERVTRHARPGTLALADLAGYRPVRREPVCGPYRVWIVCGMPPPSSGGIAVLQVLGLLEPFDIWRDKPNDLRSLHLIAEASRLAFADRARYLADPDFATVPVDGLLAPDYLASRSGLIDPARSLGKAEPGDPAGAQALALPTGADPPPSTSHLAVIDDAGNAVSFTTSIEQAFGSHLMVRGFLLNNQLTDFAFAPAEGGRPVANRVEAGKRPRSSMSPTLVFDASGRLVLAIGSPGGSAIIGYVAEALLGALDWGLGPQAAVELPHVLNRGTRTELEAGTRAEALAEPLRAMGHEVAVVPMASGLNAIAREGPWLWGAADPRREGVAMGD